MTWLIVVVAIVVVLAAVAAYKWNSSAALRQRFGPEYERILALEGGDRRRADAALRERTKRRAALDVRELSPDAHTRYRDRWYVVQGHFVDNPRDAVNEAAGLVRSVLHDRGYQGDDPDLVGPDGTAYDELDLVAVDHPEATTRFRTARDVERSASASTEELRQAFQGYKALFVSVLVRRPDPGPDRDGEADDVGEPIFAAEPPPPVPRPLTDTDDVPEVEPEAGVEPEPDDGHVQTPRGARYRVVDLRGDRRASGTADADGDGVDDRDEDGDRVDADGGGFLGRFRRNTGERTEPELR
jgi:hypothetical protein